MLGHEVETCTRLWPGECSMPESSSRVLPWKQSFVSVAASLDRVYHFNGNFHARVVAEAVRALPSAEATRKRELLVVAIVRTDFEGPDPQRIVPRLRALGRSFDRNVKEQTR